MPVVYQKTIPQSPPEKFMSCLPTNGNGHYLRPSPSLTLTPTLTPLPPSLLHSASVPSEEEKTFVQSNIHQTKSLLSELDDDITQLKQALALLESRRAYVQTHITTQEAVLSPVRRLPPEILSEVFLYVTAGCSASWPRQTLSTTDSSDATRSSKSELPAPIAEVDDTLPWRLGKVCSYWRTVFVSLPKLWSTIHLDLSWLPFSPSEKTTQLHDRAHAFLGTCLERSGQEPLTLSLKYRSFWSKANNDGARDLTCALILRLVQESERWEDVTFDLDDLFTFHNALSGARDHVPNLRSLYLASSAQISSAPRPWQAIDAFFNAPRLSSLTMMHISHPTHHLRLPWGQLKSLSSKGSIFHEGEFTRILRQSGALEEFRTEDERVLEVAAGTTLPPAQAPAATPANGNSSGNNNSAVFLPHLRTLSITNKGSYISRIFQFITAPLLTTLAIHARTSYNTEHTITMLRRSSCSLQLRKLTVESSRDLEVAWEENVGIICLLAEVKGVTECDLRVSRAADEIIPRLMVKGGKGVVIQPVLNGFPVGGAGYNGMGMGLGAANAAMVGLSMAGQGAVLLPNLESFSLEDSFCLSAVELRDMLQSRMEEGRIICENGSGGEARVNGSISRLKRVYLKLSRPAPPKYAELDGFKALAEERGMEVEVFV